MPAGHRQELARQRRLGQIAYRLASSDRLAVIDVRTTARDRGLSRLFRSYGNTMPGGEVAQS
jgi:hypothetical protein